MVSRRHMDLFMCSAISCPVPLGCLSMGVFFGIPVMPLGLFLGGGLFNMFCSSDDRTRREEELQNQAWQRQVVSSWYIRQLWQGANSQDEVPRGENEPTPWPRREWPRVVPSSTLVAPSPFSEAVPAYEEVVKKETDSGTDNGQLPPSYSEIALERF